jgi:hypothetical protein
MKRPSDKAPDLQTLTVYRLVELVPEHGYPVLVPLVGFESIAPDDLPAGNESTLADLYGDANWVRYKSMHVAYDPDQAVAYPVPKDGQALGPLLQVTSVVYTLECKSRSGQELYLGTYQSPRSTRAAAEALLAMHAPSEVTPDMIKAGEHAFALCYDASINRVLSPDKYDADMTLPDFARRYSTGEISVAEAIYAAMEQARANPAPAAAAELAGGTVARAAPAAAQVTEGTATYTELPYVFDLLYDIKSLEQLHDHLSGVRRSATSATDQQLVELMAEHAISLPDSRESEPEAPSPSV